MIGKVHQQQLNLARTCSGPNGKILFNVKEKKYSLLPQCFDHFWFVHLIHYLYVNVSVILLPFNLMYWGFSNMQYFSKGHLTESISGPFSQPTEGQRLPYTYRLCKKTFLFLWASCKHHGIRQTIIQESKCILLPLLLRKHRKCYKLRDLDGHRIHSILGTNHWVP